MTGTTGKRTFCQLQGKPNFPKMEEDMIKLWRTMDAFKKQLEKTKHYPEYTFYDGPPFATGLPHYGHVLAGTIKDVVTRYATQTGHFVSRRFGWDTHGLPIEFEIDKKLGINGVRDVEKIGIKKYNAECRSIVMRCAKEWETITERFGRWIDFENDYKTLDKEFMESVWWVFKTLHEKGLVYQGYKVMPYSTALNTPLANFEAKMPSCYQDRLDPTVIVTFPIDGDDEKTSFLAWTTTPWTLPSNLALCVNADLDYSKVLDKNDNKLYICGKARIPFVFPSKKKKKKKNKHGDDEKVEIPEETDRYKIVETFKGKALEGKTYTPLFNYFADRKAKLKNFRVLCDDYVKEGDGTMIVHQAPGFGEDDHRVCMRDGVILKDEIIPCPVDEYGCFVDPVTDYKGMYVLNTGSGGNTNKMIQDALKEKGRLHTESNLTHSYPHCWRSKTPLIYRAIPSWFVRVEKIRDKIVANNQKTYWVPDSIRSGRFHNWLANARDWAVSRNRYWGTPLPIWQSADGEETVIVGSVAELEKLSGKTGITDLHRDSVDDIVIPSKEGRGDLRRVPEVFDCWFESGSMPYAQQHYPFENQEKFKNGFPADFIAEGLDQTRGWFYTLMVLSTALFDKPAFKNLIVNGMVLAADGKKMSKSAKNYPEVTTVINENGADALRLYLITSPVVRAQELKFSDAGVKKVVTDVFLPWWNAYNFFLENVDRMEATGQKFVYDPDVHKASSNIMDKWVLSKFESLSQFVRTEMGGDPNDPNDNGYRLYTVTPELRKFIDLLTNWYVRLNRDRMKGTDGAAEATVSLQTMFHVLFQMCRLMAPFTPFIVEMMYQNLRRCQQNPEGSVHFLQLPEVRPEVIDLDTERRVDRMMEAVVLGRNARNKSCHKSQKQPLQSVTIVCEDESYVKDVQSLAPYVMSELNVKKVHFSSKFAEYIEYAPDPIQKTLGQKFRGDRGKVYAACKQLKHADLVKFQQAKTLTVLGKFEVTPDELHVVPDFKGDKDRYEHHADGPVLVFVDKQLTEELQQEKIAADVRSGVQQLRKTAGLVPSDKVTVFWETDNKMLDSVLEKWRGYLEKDLRSEVLPMAELEVGKYTKRGESGVKASMEAKVDGVVKVVLGSVNAE